MTPNSNAHGDYEMGEDFIIHGERLSRLEAMLESMEKNYLAPIRDQVTKTNGRVGKLESKAERHGAWIGFLWVSVSVLAIFFSGVFVQHVLAVYQSNLFLHSNLYCQLHESQWPSPGWN